MRDPVTLRTIFVIVFCGWVGFVDDARAQEANPPSAEADVAQSRADGKIEIADAQVSLIQNTFVAAPIAGVVSKVLVAEGDQVEVGRRLVQLDSEQAQTELEAAQAAYEAARLESDNDVDARYAKRTLEVRQRELEQSMIANNQFPGSVSETEIAKLQLVVDQSRLAIEQAEHDLKVARAGATEKLAASRIVEARLRKHGVEAPVSGYAVEIAVEPGEWVEAGKPIVRVISLDPIRVECFVDGRTHGRELVGRGIEFYPAGRTVVQDQKQTGGRTVVQDQKQTGGRTVVQDQKQTGGETGASDSSQPLVGKVTFVSPELHPVTGQARLWATIDNPKFAARAGMRGRIVIQIP